MITHLSGVVTFPINGVRLDLELSGQPGITAIIGENGSGKSFLGSELPRYLLFGKKALRGAAADYKNLDAKGTFTIAGKVYEIARSAKEEQIVDAKGNVLAVGADAVTKKCEELLGYGLEVFDICNCSPQKKTDLFGRMQPAKRKQLIDRVIGLTSNEKVEKACRDEAAGYRREVDALSRQLREPVKPAEPEGYVNSNALQQMVDEGRVALRKRAEIMARIKPIAHPVFPEGRRPDDEEVAELERQQGDYLVNSRRRAELDAIIVECIPHDKDDWTDDQLLAAAGRLVAKEALERRGPKPTTPLTELEVMTGQWAAVENFDAQAHEETECPKCGHKFLTGGERPEEPWLSKEQIAKQRAAHAAHADKIKLPDGPDLTLAQINHARAARAAKERYNAAVKELAELPVLLDMSVSLAALREQLAEWRACDAALERVLRQERENDAAERELMELGTVKTQETIDALADRLADARVYEAALVEFERVQTEMADLSAQIAEKQKMAEEFAKGGAALADARATVKSFLAPALSRVSSAIINDMTLGKLSSVVVDDDMEITVNAQRLETLSGAGETVANIALRIALGQVLVKNTFPVFIGDEMDSDADDLRRQATAEAIRNLKDRLSQIILITHRDSEIADQVINLNDTR